MLLETLSTPLKRVRSVNSTTTSFTFPSATKTEPTNLDAGTAVAQVVIDLVKNKQGGAQNGILLLPYGVGDDNDVFAMRVVVWKEVQAELGNIDPATVLWVPFELGEFTCTLSAYTGAANSLLPAAARFCDTIALVRPAAENAAVTFHSPANDTPGHIMMDVKGARKLEFLFDMTTGDPTSANCLYSLL